MVTGVFCRGRFVVRFDPHNRYSQPKVPSVAFSGFFSIGGNRKGKGEKERKERKKERRKGRKKKKKKRKRKEKKGKKKEKGRKKKRKKEKRKREEKKEEREKYEKKVKRFGKEGTKKLGFPRIREDTRVERFFLLNPL